MIIFKKKEKYQHSQKNDSSDVFQTSERQSLAEQAKSKLRQISLTEEIQRELPWQLTQRENQQANKNISSNCLEVNLDKFRLRKAYQTRSILYKTKKRSNRQQQIKRIIQEERIKKQPCHSVNLRFHKKEAQDKHIRIHSKIFHYTTIETKKCSIVNLKKKKQHRNTTNKTISSFPSHYNQKKISFNYKPIKDIMNLKDLICKQQVNIFYPIISLPLKGRLYTTRHSTL